MTLILVNKFVMFFLFNMHLSYSICSFTFDLSRKVAHFSSLVSCLRKEDRTERIFRPLQNWI